MNNECVDTNKSVSAAGDCVTTSERRDLISYRSFVNINLSINNIYEGPTFEENPSLADCVIFGV